MSGNITAVRFRARLARTGQQEYEGLGAEQRDASEVFAPESLATLANCPVQIGHDDGAPAVGYVLADSHGRERGPDGHEYLTAELVITDQATIARIRSGELRGISMGYATELVSRDGVLHQTQIRHQHCALLRQGVERPRCGDHCSVQKDQDNMTTRQTDAIPLSLITDGTAADATPCTCGGRSDAAALNNIDALVEQRHMLLMRAGKLLPGNYDTAGRSNEQIRSDAVAAKLGAASIAGKSAEYIAARFDALVDGTAPARWHNGMKGRADAVRNDINSSDEAFRDHLAKQFRADSSDDDAPAPANVPTAASLTAQSAAETDEAFRAMLAAKLGGAE